MSDITQQSLLAGVVLRNAEIMRNEKQKIIPCLWFEKECEEAMNFYVSAFSDIPGDLKESGIISIQRYETGMNTPGIENMIGKVLTGIFDLAGFRFMALDGGPVFEINPSISFILNFDETRIKDARKWMDALWRDFSGRGKIIMELQEYPFSRRYGWLRDKYGVNWQFILQENYDADRPFIIPSLLFSGTNNGKAEEAINYYLSVFNNSQIGALELYPDGSEMEGYVMYSDFMLENQWFAAMDTEKMSEVLFNEAVSLVVNCFDQEEVDRLWGRLTAVPEAEVCGWLKDKFGLSWQIIPERMGELLTDPDKRKVMNVINSMLNMKKIEISELEIASEYALHQQH